MKLNITNPVVIHREIETLYQNFISSISDIMWEDHSLIRNNDFMTDFETLAREDVEGIRNLFRQGHAMLMLAGNDCATLETNHAGDGCEIRLYNRKGECVGVILNSEINY